ncbi:MAG TPA: MFS transporter, partial [Terrimicrobiaceae bacterium]
GIWTALTGIGLAIGPVLGGLLTSALGWRWVFFVNVPVVIVALVICLVSVRETARQNWASRRIDWVGFFLMMAGIGSLITAMVEAPRAGWRSAFTITLLLIAICALLLLYVVETKREEPIVDFRLFARRRFLAGSLANFTLIAFAYAGFFLIPLYLTNMMGQEPYQIGFTMLPITGLIAIIAPLAGRIVDVKGPKLPIIVGLVSLAASAVVQFSLGHGSSLWQILVAFIFMGTGWGLIFGPAAFAAISSLPQTHAATATGALWTIQNLGGSLGLAVAGLVFRYQEQRSLTNGLALANVDLTENQQQLVRSLLADPERSRQVLSEFAGTTAEKVTSIFDKAFVTGYTSAFAFLLCLSISALLLVVFVMTDAATGQNPTAAPEEKGS